MEPAVSVNVVKSPECASLTMTPKALYQEIRKLAEKRYNFTLLPKKMWQVKCLDSPANKMSVLRDICYAVGLQVNLRPDMHLENDNEKLRSLIASKLIAKTQISNKKKG